MKSVVIGLAAIAAMAVAAPASAEIVWKSCATYMEGHGPTAWVVAWNVVPQRPLTSAQRAWVREISSKCESSWAKPDGRCHVSGHREHKVVFNNITGGHFDADCKTGFAHAMASPYSSDLSVQTNAVTDPE